jgi:hypothetical protein
MRVGNVIEVASNFGGKEHPHWYYDLLAHPECQSGGEAFRAAEVTDPVEYARLYDRAERSYAGYIDYRVKTVVAGRRIPILRLTPCGLKNESPGNPYRNQLRIPGKELQ